MLDENLDNMSEIIRVASDGYHPAYDDKAWNKMEVLLGKRLPQNVEKKNWIFIILLILGIALVSFLIIMIKKHKINKHKDVLQAYQQIEKSSKIKTLNVIREAPDWKM